MPLIDGFSKGVVNVSKVTRLGPVEPLNNLLMELRMVAFEGEYIVSPPLNNGLGNVLLTVKGVYRDDTALEKRALRVFQGFEETLNRKQTNGSPADHTSLILDSPYISVLIYRNAILRIIRFN